MQLKLIFSLLLLIFTGCASGEKKVCQDKKVFSMARQHGTKGSSDLMDHFIKKCHRKDEFKLAYQKGFQEGIRTFCTKERGQSQASYGLKKESICADILNYSTGYLSELSIGCTSEKALEDVRTHLHTTNQLCKTVPKYKNAYLHALKQSCTYKKGKSLGYAKKIPDGLCRDSKNLKTFLSGHLRGIQITYNNDNLQISKDLRKLRVHRRSLKRKLKTDLKPQETIDLKLKLNKMESRILDLQSTYETNKKIIRN